MSLSAALGDSDIEEGTGEAKAVDNLLSRELLQLSIHDRTALQEEIHGVKCLAPEETPQLLQASLQKLAMVLASDEIIPQSKKLAYLRSQSLPRTYINSNEFRLRFLRSELFDVIRAARRMVKFLNLLVLFFGEHLLERPVRLSDLNKKELQYMRNGNLQYLPFRDRSGRRIITIINPTTYSAKGNEEFISQTKDAGECNPFSMEYKGMFQGKMFSTAKIFLYMLWVAGEDVDVQRKGIVVIVWFDPSFTVVTKNRMSSFADTRVSPSEIASVRVVAFHLCVPDSPVYRFVEAIMKLRVGTPGRLHMKTHFGESVELLYKLQSFGIPTEHIPISFSGTIKTGYLKQWTRARETQESTLYVELAVDFKDVIECPQLSDVLFRQGISLIWNPGNASVRSLIEEMQRNRGESGSNKLIKVKRREMVLDIIQEVSKTSRFLVWNEGGWWNEIHDREQLILKIEYVIKEVRKSKRAERQQVSLNSSTSIFYGNRRRGGPNNVGGNNDSSDEDVQPCGKSCFS